MALNPITGARAPRSVTVIGRRPKGLWEPVRVLADGELLLYTEYLI